MLLMSLIIKFSLLGFTSNTCAPDDIYHHRGIDCCLDSEFTEQSCEDVIESLPQSIIETFKQVRQDIAIGLYQENHYPNCFWASLAFFDENVLNNSRLYATHEIFSILREYFLETAAPSTGDLILFSNSQTMIVDPTMNVYTTTSVPFHSAIYLGDDLVLQKENYTDEVFSIVRFEDAYAGYTNASLRQFGVELNVTYHNYH